MMMRWPAVSACAVRHLIDLGQRPERHVVKLRKLWQRIARSGGQRDAAVPQLDRPVGGNDIAQRHRLALGLRGGRRDLDDRVDQLLMDGIHLVDIDVGDLLVPREVEACVVPLIALLRDHIAAAQNAVRKENVDIALDVERHLRTGVSRVDGDDEAHRDVFLAQNVRERQGAEPAHRVADQDDRSRILAVIDNGLRGNQPANRELVDIGLDAGLFELIGQLIHPARKDRTERTAEQIDAPSRRRRGFLRLGRRDRQVRRSRRIARRHDGSRQCRLRTGQEDAGRQHGACHGGCKLSWIDHALSARVFDVRHVQPWRARGAPPGPTGCLVAEEWAEFAARGRNGAPV